MRRRRKSGASGMPPRQPAMLADRCRGAWRSRSGCRRGGRRGTSCVSHVAALLCRRAVDCPLNGDQSVDEADRLDRDRRLVQPCQIEEIVADMTIKTASALAAKLAGASYFRITGADDMRVIGRVEVRRRGQPGPRNCRPDEGEVGNVLAYFRRRGRRCRFEKVL